MKLFQIKTSMDVMDLIFNLNLKPYHNNREIRLYHLLGKLAEIEAPFVAEISDDIRKRTLATPTNAHLRTQFQNHYPDYFILWNNKDSNLLCIFHKDHDQNEIPAEFFTLRGLLERVKPGETVTIFYKDHPTYFGNPYILNTRLKSKFKFKREGNCLYATKC